MQDFVRQFVGFITQGGIAFIGHFIFLVRNIFFLKQTLFDWSNNLLKYLTRPTSGNTTFPYHVKTNQINIVEEAADNFPHHKDDQGGHLNFVQIESSMNVITNLFTVESSRKYETEN